ncbi:hypothetical protein [Aliarcobacter butzleri]|uniref:hypothetical protein n=1 Tax=Aliarcobacter butzleri TaxID=28197 RepID=UPI00062E7B8B|nr:hypothetical protein [Aliarcobacter butzleri]KLD98796.1 hypothetical protein AF74_01965 [Aliarcobacter butzleri L349]
MKAENKLLIIVAILLILKYFNITSVDWVFISIFIIYVFLSLPEINLKNIDVNFNTLFESNNNLKQKIWELENQIEELKKLDNNR